MLLEKPIQAGDVVSLKLINGDEIIARLEADDQHGITISKALAITVGPQGLGMIPWLFLGAKDTLTIKRDHIFAMVASKKEAADQYLQGTTGIALA